MQRKRTYYGDGKYFFSSDRRLIDTNCFFYEKLNKNRFKYMQDKNGIWMQITYLFRRRQKIASTKNSSKKTKRSCNSKTNPAIWKLRFLISFIRRCDFRHVTKSTWIFDAVRPNYSNNFIGHLHRSYYGASENDPVYQRYDNMYCTVHRKDVSSCCPNPCVISIYLQILLLLSKRDQSLPVRKF